MTMFFDPFQDFDHLTGALLRQAGSGSGVMPVDLYREGDHYVLNADLPGVDPNTVDVSVEGQTLTLRAERMQDEREGVEWLSRERPSVAFVRQFNVSDGIDADGITATHENGVLSVLIPVSEEAKPRKIEVTASRSQKSVGTGKTDDKKRAEQPMGTTQEADAK